MNQNELRDLALRYPVTIRPDADEGYVAVIPDFPRVYTNGGTPAEALANAYEGIAEALTWYDERGQVPPTPALLEEAEEERADAAAIDAAEAELAASGVPPRPLEELLAEHGL